ncbi:MAG: NAD(P)-dependent oxidoreductase [Anaerolineales bacterium]
MSSKNPAAPNPVNTPIGLIGVGTMGRLILRCLIDAGYPVIVHDVSAEAIGLAESWGAEVVNTPAKVSSACKFVLLCLPGPVETERTVCGEDGLLIHVKPDHIIIDLSTSDPSTTVRLAEETAENHGAFLDAPILGRPASIGNWVLPVGGDHRSLERSRPILESFASRAVLVGPPGAGHTLKLLNQLMFSTINAITAEIMALCSLTELSPETLFTTIADSGAATVSGLFRENGKKIIERDFESIFSIDLLFKDTDLGIKMARGYGASAVVAELVQKQNEIARSTGLGEEDSSALVKVYEDLYDVDATR